MTIIASYATDPGFPATDNNPSAVRYNIGGAFYDATGGQPSQSDVDTYNGPSASQTRYAAFKADANYQALLAQLKSATPAQVQSYITSQVTDLASARAMLIKVCLVLALVANGS